jgi:hypothetical protein
MDRAIDITIQIAVTDLYNVVVSDRHDDPSNPILFKNVQEAPNEGECISRF